MAIGPALPGGGVDPLFTVVFASAAAINVIPALLPTPVDLREIGVIGALHGVPRPCGAGSRGGCASACRGTRKLSSHQIGTLIGKIVISARLRRADAASAVTLL